MRKTYNTRNTQRQIYGYKDTHVNFFYFWEALNQKNSDIKTAVKIHFFIHFFSLWTNLYFGLLWPDTVWCARKAAVNTTESLPSWHLSPQWWADRQSTKILYDTPGGVGGATLDQSLSFTKKGNWIIFKSLCLTNYTFGNLLSLSFHIAKMEIIIIIIL